MNKEIYTLDIVGNGVIERSVFQSTELRQINKWIGFYVNIGYIPQIRITNEYEKPTCVYVE